MNKTLLNCVFLVLLYHQFHWTDAQIHYVPAQILIPTFNITHFNGTNMNNTINWTNMMNNNTINKNNWTSSNTWRQNRTGIWNGTTPDGNLIVGNVGLYDRLLFNQEFFKPRRWWSRREKIVEYPNNGYGRHETISAIRVYNRYYDGLDSSATITAGGVGYRYVKIQLVSKWGKGFRYLVQIFGR